MLLAVGKLFPVVVENNAEHLYCLSVGSLERNQHSIKLYKHWATAIEKFRCENQSTVGIREAFKPLLGE